VAEQTAYVQEDAVAEISCPQDVNPLCIVISRHIYLILTVAIRGRRARRVDT
jgi:hypothetical protein